MKLNNPLERVRDVIHSGMGPSSGGGRSFLYLQTNQITPNPLQPRLRMDGPAMEDLRNSISESGVLEPIIVRQKEDHYEIISGERRWRACCALGIKEIPCILKQASDEESFKLALMENLQRDDLTPLEEAHAYRRLLELGIAKNQNDIARLLGVRQQRVSEKLQLLKLPAPVQDLFSNSEHQKHFSQKHAELLAKLRDPNQIQAAAKKVTDEKLSTRETREFVAQLLAQTSNPNQTLKPTKPEQSLHITRNRYGFTLKFAFDCRRNALDDSLNQLLASINTLRKEYTEANNG